MLAAKKISPAFIEDFWKAWPGITNGELTKTAGLSAWAEERDEQIIIFVETLDSQPLRMTLRESTHPEGVRFTSSMPIRDSHHGYLRYRAYTNEEWARDFAEIIHRETHRSCLRVTGKEKLPSSFSVPRDRLIDHAIGTVRVRLADMKDSLATAGIHPAFEIDNDLLKIASEPDSETRLTLALESDMSDVRLWMAQEGKDQARSYLLNEKISAREWSPTVFAKALDQFRQESAKAMSADARNKVMDDDLGFDPSLVQAPSFRMAVNR